LKMATDFLMELFEVVKGRKRKPVEGSYTSRLLSQGAQGVVGKFGEECSELVAAACGQGDMVSEAADVLFHLLVLLALKDVELSSVIGELERRRRR